VRENFSDRIRGFKNSPQIALVRIESDAMPAIGNFDPRERLMRRSLSASRAAATSALQTTIDRRASCYAPPGRKVCLRRQEAAATSDWRIILRLVRSSQATARRRGFHKKYDRP
jgi:hypothetical protein